MDKNSKRLRLALTARPIDTLIYWQKEGMLDLNPPYQRGEVWGEQRQQNLILSIIIGVPLSSIITNDRWAAGWGEKIAVIDGKQRITAILKFLHSELPVQGHWLELDSEFIRFSELPMATQRGLKMTPIPFSEGQLTSLEDEIEVFELVNFGGVPQGETDL